MKILILALVFPLYAYTQAHDDEFACNPPDPEWSTERVAEWAKNLDILGSKAMRSGTPCNPKNQKIKGQCFTAFGNPVDDSCYNSIEPKKWALRLKRMEEGIAYAVTQAQRCWSTLGFGSTRGFLSKIRRAKFNCTNSKSRGLAASASMGGIFSPTFDHEYTMNDWGAYMDNEPMETVGSTLFHEALHWTVNNNREWHNCTDRNRTGCDKSQFEDRVYLMEAACFPESDVGQQLYGKNGAIKCANVCKNSLTQADKGAIAWHQRNFQKGSQGLFGHSYKPAEADLICERIKNVPENYQKSQQERAAIVKKAKAQLIWAQKHWGKSEDAKQLATLLEEALMTAENAYDPNLKLDGIKKVFNEQRAKLKAELTKVCAEPHSNTLAAFCNSHTPEKNPIIDGLAKIAKDLDRVNPKDFSLYMKARPVPKLDPKY